MESWDVLQRHFGGLTADEVDAELAGVPATGASPASQEAADYLARHGGPDLQGVTVRGEIHQRRALVAARTLSESVRSALTLDQVAQELGLSKSRVSHRLSDGGLWAFTVQGRRYFPRWQFIPDGEVLPGMTTIVPAIPPTLHPLALEAFMTAPQTAFDGRSPVEWLAGGGDPTVIADWLTGMAHG